MNTSTYMQARALEVKVLEARPMAAQAAQVVRPLVALQARLPSFRQGKATARGLATEVMILVETPGDTAEPIIPTRTAPAEPLTPQQHLEECNGPKVD